MTKASERQPTPVAGDVVVVDRVLDDIRERAEVGKDRYGTYLQTNNGRDALWDAYQEAIDLVMYLRQAILERDGQVGRGRVSVTVPAANDTCLGAVAGDLCHRDLGRRVACRRLAGDDPRQRQRQEDATQQS